MMATIIQWGNEWVFGTGNEPVKMISRKTGAAITSVLPADDNGTVFEWEDVAVTRGPATLRTKQNDDPIQEQNR
jgi:hypothetical protein